MKPRSSVVEYVVTKFKNMKTKEEEYVQEKLRKELELIQIAKQKNQEMASKSFEAWQKNNIEKVGRAIGFRINISKGSLKKLWTWLMG